VSLKELIYLSSLAKSTASAQIFEIGTSMGRTTLNMAINLNPGGHIYTLDLPEGYIPDESCYARAQEKEVRDLPRAHFLRPYLDHLPVTLLQGESTSFDFSPWFGKMDLVFVDGGHTSKVLESDSENALKLIKKSGLIIWHDYGQPLCPEVEQFINNLAERLPLRRIEGTNMALYNGGLSSG
jgi:predicted O-methyltransferase YrrM